MIKAKEELLDKVIAVFGYEHKKTIAFAEILEIAADTEDAVAELNKLAEQIIKKEREENENEN